MTDDSLDDLLDDPFHGCAIAAYVELAVECGGVPDVNATRRLAFRYYEELLAEKHRTKVAVPVEEPNSMDRNPLERIG